MGGCWNQVSAPLERVGKASEATFYPKMYISPEQDLWASFHIHLCRVNCTKGLNNHILQDSSSTLHKQNITDLDAVKYLYRTFATEYKIRIKQ